MNQFFAFAKTGEITISEGYCIGAKRQNGNITEGLFVVRCAENESDPMQSWSYNRKVSAIKICLEKQLKSSFLSMF